MRLSRFFIDENNGSLTQSIGRTVRARYLVFRELSSTLGYFQEKPARAHPYASDRNGEEEEEGGRGVKSFLGGGRARCRLSHAPRPPSCFTERSTKGIQDSLPIDSRRHVFFPFKYRFRFSSSSEV